MIKSDRWIERMATQNSMITPFEPRQVRLVDSRPVISYGLSSYGYDIRVGRVFKVLDPAKARPGVIDPKAFHTHAYEDVEGDVCIIAPHGMAIAQSFETFRIPREVLAIVNGKSTYSRCGIQVSITPLEPEWIGRLTFAISNTTSQPAKVYAEEGIAQILFLGSDEVCKVSYADKQGKYQSQTEMTLPKV